MSNAAVHTDEMPLPGVLAEIESVAGRDAALAVAAERGGGEVYIPSPRGLAGDHWLVSTVGAEAAERICELYKSSHYREHRGRGRDFAEHKGHGARIEVPAIPAIMRRLKVRFMSIAGTPVPTIARQLGITARTVRKIRVQLRATGEIE